MIFLVNIYNAFEKPGKFAWKIELQLSYSLIIFVKILHMIPTYQCVQKGCSRFASFCLDLELFAKIKRPGFYSFTETRFINNAGSKQNKKILKTLL